MKYTFLLNSLLIFWEIKFIGVNDNVEAAQDQPTDLSIGQDLAIEPDSSKTEVLDPERIDLNYLIEAILRAHKATSLTSEEIREKWRMGIDQNKLDYYKNMVIIFSSFCLNLFSLTKIYLQSNEDLWQTTAEELENSCYEVIDFCRFFMAEIFDSNGQMRLLEGGK